MLLLQKKQTQKDEAPKSNGGPCDNREDIAFDVQLSALFVSRIADGRLFLRRAADRFIHQTPP